MPTFKIIQNRKPWNKSAEWLLAYATRMAQGEARSRGFTQIEQIKTIMKQDFETWCIKNRKNPDRISITTWEGNPGEFYCSINQPGSQSDAAFKICMTTDEKAPAST